MKKNNPQCFVIVTQPRSGSYHLVSLLNSAQDIRCYSEVFKKQFVELPEDHLKTLGIAEGDVATRDLAGREFLEILFQIEDAPIQGFKAFLEHLQPAGIKNPRARTDWKYVFLQRNSVSSYVSGKRAETTGIYVMNDGDEISSDVRYHPITIEVEKLKKWLVWQDKLAAKWLKYRDKVGAERIHFIDYRDLQNAEHLDRLLAFLGSAASSQELRSQRAKQFDRPFWDGVENASEVQSFLSSSDWAHLLPELEHP